MRRPPARWWPRPAVATLRARRGRRVGRRPLTGGSVAGQPPFWPHWKAAVHIVSSSLFGLEEASARLNVNVSLAPGFQLAFPALSVMLIGVVMEASDAV